MPAISSSKNSAIGFAICCCIGRCATTTAARVAICQDRDDVLDLYIERLRPAHHLMLEKK